MKAPFPWFGGKSRVADIVWDRFGDIPNYVEPFAGSLAVLLARPHEPRAETVNDIDCYLANFWRAITAAPDEVARWADWPVNEADLHARHLWLVDRVAFRERIKTEPEHFDAKVAGWWVWGISQWIGSGWCRNTDRRRQALRGCMPGVHKASLHAKRPRLARGGRGVSRQKPDLSGDSGAFGRGVHACALEERGGLRQWFDQLSERLRRVRVCCGDWKRILGPSPTTCIGTTGVFLDPPYAVEDRAECYSNDDFDVAHAVREWAIANGDNPKLRIALCGYEGEHTMPASWDCIAWKAHGGYARGDGEKHGQVNAARERLWFSPHCLENGGAGRQARLFA